MLLEGISDEDVVEILSRVSMKVSKGRKYIFDGHTAEDIVQRGIYEGLKCLHNGKYDKSKGKGETTKDSLERFMSVHIRRRLGNYKRDMMRKNNAGAEKGIINPMSLFDIPIVDDSDNYAEDASHREMVDRIKSALSSTPEMLTDFHRLMDGSSLPSQRKNKLRQRISIILEELRYGVEEED